MASQKSLVTQCDIIDDSVPIEIHLDVSTNIPYWLVVDNCHRGRRKLTTVKSQLNQSLVFKASPKPGDIRVSLIPAIDQPTPDLSVSKFSILPHEQVNSTGLSEISAIYYINLKSRPARRRHILKQLTKIQANIPIFPIDAVPLPSNPQVGCAMSHMKALSHARQHEFTSIMILEDDFTFHTSRVQLDQQLTRLFSYYPNWEVVQLSTVNSKTVPTRTPGITKVIRADTTAGYLVRDTAIIPLFNIFLQCCRQNPNMPIMATNQQAIDVAWQPVQAKMNWLLFEPNLGYQSEEFPSDIEGYRIVRPFV